MKFWTDAKISNKILYSIIATSLSLTLVLSLSSNYFVKRISLDSLQEKTASLATLTAETVKAAVQYSVNDDVEKVLNQLVSSDTDVGVVAVIIQGPKGDFTVSAKKTAKEFATVDLALPLKKLAADAPREKGEVKLLGGNRLQFVAAKMDLTSNDIISNGYLLLALNDTRSSHVLSIATATMTALSFTVMLIGTVCAFWLSSNITRPLKKAVGVANALAEGDLRSDVAVDSMDEIGQLMSALQYMVENLRDVILKTVNISDGIVTASNQLLTTSSEIATGAKSLASQTETVATASEQMAATSSVIANNCTRASEASQYSTHAANTGAVIVQETIAGMGIIAERVHLTSKTVEALGVRSEQIGDIVGTIEDIADQTNLLALNAAIEAARAGEQGRGFAVVADEVRVLAVRTTNATKEIGAMIKGIQKETSDAVKAMDVGVREVEKGIISSQKSGEALEEILNRIREASLQMVQIASAVEQQTAATSEVTTNIQQITHVVSLTAMGSVETAKAAAQLAGQAKKMQEMVGRFKLA